MNERQPGRTGNDQDRREEHEKDVLDHVHEEVLARPVVDRRVDREEENR
jgi:hypothetical protein